MGEFKDECPNCKSHDLEIRTDEHKYIGGKQFLRYQYCLDCDWEQSLD